MHIQRATIGRAALCLAAFALLLGCSRQKPAGYQGYVEGRFVYIASSQSGRLERLNVVRGDTVTTGRLLFTLDEQPETAAMQEANEALRASKSKLSDLETGRRPQEIDITRAQLAQALAQQRQSESILRSDQAQYGAGGLPQTELISAQAAADVSAARVKELEADLQVDRLPAREQQIRAQREQMAGDRAALAQAKWRLEQKQVSSPRQGVVFDTLYREGEWVAAGNPVVKLLPPENVEIRFFVPETVVGSLRVGRSISVQCDGCATRLTAQISFVSPQSEYTPPLIYSNENRAKLVFMIVAKPAPQQAASLHPGQPVEVFLQ